MISPMSQILGTDGAALFATIKILFNATDAISMYPNIDTDERLAAFLISYETKIVKYTKNVTIKQLIRALHVLMKHNVFRFGTTYYRQKDGAAIGVPPATDWAIQMFAFYEMTVLQDLFGKHLRLDKIIR